MHDEKLERLLGILKLTGLSAPLVARELGISTPEAEALLEQNCGDGKPILAVDHSGEKWYRSKARRPQESESFRTPYQQPRREETIERLGIRARPQIADVPDTRARRRQDAIDLLVKLDAPASVLSAVRSETADLSSAYQYFLAEQNAVTQQAMKLSVRQELLRTLRSILDDV